MAGHSKWSKVKHIKGAADAKRGKLFSRLAKEVAVAARAGGSDPDLNPRLRSAIAAAKAQNMPNDTIDRAVRKGAGEIEGQQVEEILYEGYGPNGVALLVETATDNRNRTIAEVRSAFTKHNGNLGSSGSVVYMFERKGQITVPGGSIEEERLLELTIEAGGEELTREGDEYVISTAHDQLYATAEALRGHGVAIDSQKLVYLPQNTVPVPDEQAAVRVLRLCEALEECEDVQNLYSNFDIPDEVLTQLST